MLTSYHCKFIFLTSFVILYFIYTIFKTGKYSNFKLANCSYEGESDQKVREEIRKDLPWYFNTGEIRPQPKNLTDIWPDEANGDRITKQLMYVPKDTPWKVKKIYAESATYLNPKIGWQEFINSKCPVAECVLVSNKKTADAVLYQLKVNDVRNSDVPTNQIWILYTQESPFHSGMSKYVNWTVTYRSDSDIPLPYGKWIYYNESVKTKAQEKNYALGKCRKVAWFVSNCGAKNNRMEYARELQKYIDVDIYGSCGDLKCPRYDKKCMEMLRKEYKFYLAFENSNCREYVTEKFFQNALQQGVLPIVMGAHPDDYEKLAPYNSYIHVDRFSSPKELADYLHELDKNDSLYNSYFQWKGTGEFIDTRLFCRLCAMLHSDRQTQSYENFMDWWDKPGTCIKGSWLK